MEQREAIGHIELIIVCPEMNSCFVRKGVRDEINVWCNCRARLAAPMAELYPGFSSAAYEPSHCAENC